MLLDYASSSMPAPRATLADRVVQQTSANTFTLEQPPPVLVLARSEPR
jgi:hypothetical protein